MTATIRAIERGDRAALPRLVAARWGETVVAHPRVAVTTTNDELERDV